jgi:hypothetical protein
LGLWPFCRSQTPRLRRLELFERDVPGLITRARMAVTRQFTRIERGCAPTAFGVASPYSVSIARLRIALEALNPITACRHDGPDNIVANPRVRLMIAEISRASAR